MKHYKIVMRNSTVTNTHNVVFARSNRARKYVLAQYAGSPGWSLYKMWRTF